MKTRAAGFALLLIVWLLLIGSLLSLSALNPALSLSLASARQDQQTAASLAQTKRTLLGRAAADTALPGSLPCPDSNDDGSAELLSGNDCPTYLGRVPYKTLGMPRPLDGNGETLWYALSRNFRDDNSNAVGSDSSGDLQLNGTPVLSNLAALIFAPGAAVSGQSRSASRSAPCVTSGTTLSETLCAANYLEGGNASLNTKTARNLVFTLMQTSSQFNDQVLTIGADELLRLVEKRMLREIKSCLDDYAAASSGRYPWAASSGDTSAYRAQVGTRFGRVPTQPRPLRDASPLDANVSTLLDALAVLQFSLDRYAASNTSANRSALKTAGQTLDSSAISTSLAQPGTPPLPAAVTSNASATGRAAQELAKSPPGSTVASVRTLLQTTIAGLTTAGVPLDSGMSVGWPASCTQIGGNYWNNWRNFVFYQVAEGAQPGGSGCGSNCLLLNDTGGYRAMLLIAGKALAGQTPRSPTDVGDYLEGDNLHSGATSNRFVSYRLNDPLWLQINDQAACLDGEINCR